jgi:pimeloyl-ACP methyl ester carboxylesterase
MLLAAMAAPLLAPNRPSAQTAPRPFRVDIPQRTVDHILNRVRDAQWPERLDAGDWRYGANWDYMKALAQYWVEKYDWRKAEANLNRHPQFLAQMGDFDIHFYHVKGRGPKPVPLVLTHGWPGSVVEFVEAIGPLSDPASYGGSPDDAFDVIVPSLPGFGFSSKPKGKPVGFVTTAELWHRLMTEVLGYTKYGAQGGDWGLGVTLQLARQHPAALVGVHFNGLVEGGPPPPESEQTPEERAWRQAATAYRTAELDYFNEQRRKPETVACALSDNPLGTAAWIAEKLKVWSDPAGGIEPPFTKDQVLTNVMLYLVTNTIGTSVWYYRGTLDEPPATGKFTVPTGFTSSPGESPLLNPPQYVLARNYNLVHYSKMPRGGHFAFWEQPEAMVADVREFFQKLRS